MQPIVIVIEPDHGTVLDPVCGPVGEQTPRSHIPCNHAGHDFIVTGEFETRSYSFPSSRKLKYAVRLKMMWSSNSIPTIDPAALSWVVMLMSLGDGSRSPLGWL